MQNFFSEISILLLIVVAVAAIMRLLRQPLIIGHILSGIIAGPFLFNVIESYELLEVFSQLGVAILLFIIGLSLNPKIVKEVGKVALVTGAGQVLGTTIVGFIIGQLLGFTIVTSIYIAIAISFSSTIIIMKLLADKRELGQLYGKVSVGFLLIQDLIASLILIGVASSTQGGSLGGALLIATAKIVAISVTFIILARYVLPRVGRFAATSQELLFIVSLAWGIGVAAFVKEFGLSLEIGGLLAGVAFAATDYAKEMSTRLQPLRDIFLVIFFILLGAHMNIDGLSTVIVPALLYSSLILIGNPIIVMTLMRYLGYRKKTNFKAGLAVAQISEFSLILVVLGNRVGHISSEIVSLVTVIALITIAGSSYFIIYADSIYKRIEGLLSIFERKKTHSDRTAKEGAGLVIFGFNNNLLEYSAGGLLPSNKKYLVVDKDPAVIDLLQDHGMPHEYGDVADVEFLNELHLENTHFILSNIRNKDVNKLLMLHARSNGFNGIVTVNADNKKDALELYEAGADYVEIPSETAAKETARLIQKHGLVKSHYKELGTAHLEKLRILLADKSA